MEYAKSGALRHYGKWGRFTRIDREDYISAAYLGLVQAARTYREGHGAGFKSWVFTSCEWYVRRLATEVRLEEGFSRVPTKAEAADGKQGMQRRVSLVPWPQTSNDDDAEAWQGPSVMPDYDSRVLAHQQRARVLNAVSDERLRRYLAMKFDGLTYRQIGERAGVSSQRVQQLIEPLIEQLKQTFRTA